jgi:malate dehydrogenase
MKVTVIGGAGVVGSAGAFRLAQDGKVSEIVLLDVRERLAEAHAFDMDQGVACRSTTRVRAGGMDDTGNSDIVIVAAPQHDAAAMTREHFAAQASRVLEAVRPVLAGSPSALWIVATNPVDPLAYLLSRKLSVPRNKVIGLNRNDTTRFRWAIGRVLSVPSTAVEAYTLGQHGPTQVPLFSSIRIDGRPVTLSADETSRIRAEATSFGARWAELNPDRTAGWASAESIGDVVAAIASDDGRIVPCSTALEGEYGLSDVSVGVPVTLGQGGVKKIVELPLDAAEREALIASAAAIRQMIKAAEE